MTNMEILLPPEVWDTIFNGSSVFTGKVVLSRSSSVFEAVLRRNLFEQCVAHLIPVLAHYLTKNDLLKVRQVCKSLKKSTDEIEIEMEKTDSCGKRFKKHLEVSLEGSEKNSWSDLTWNMNKFGLNCVLGRALAVHLQPKMDAQQRMLEFLKMFGHRIVSLKVRIAMREPEQLRSLVWQYLSYVKNLKRFELIPEILSNDLNEAHFKRARMMEDNERIKPLDLRFLTEALLSSRHVIKIREYRDIPYKNTDGFFTKLFHSQTPQIKKLKMSDWNYMTPALRLMITTLQPMILLTELNIKIFFDRTCVENLLLLERQGVKLKKLTLRSAESCRFNDEMGRILMNYLQITDSLNFLQIDLHIEFEFANPIGYLPCPFLVNSPMEHLEREPEIKTLRSLVLTDVYFPQRVFDGFGLMKGLETLSLIYTTSEVVASEMDIIEGNHCPRIILFQLIPNLRQLSIKLTNKPVAIYLN